MIELGEDILNVFYELFTELPRQGPGSNECTARAYGFFEGVPKFPKILDIGCGTGMQTLELARLSEGKVTGLDKHQDALDKLEAKSIDLGLIGNIETKNGSMFDLPYPDDSFDIIWAEGSIYIMGFEEGLTNWRRFLKPKGFVAVTEVSWLKPSPPTELETFWKNEYPGIKSVEENIEIITQTGYKLIKNFTLPDSVWWDQFYLPLEKRIAELEPIYKGNNKARDVLEITKLEIEYYRKYSDYYGYVFYIMKKN